MRGDLYHLRAPRNARGNEQQGPRYAVVVQSEDYAALSTWLVAPTSTSAQPSRVRPVIEVDGQETLVLADQTTAVTRDRLGGWAGHLKLREVQDLDAALREVLDLS